MLFLHVLLPLSNHLMALAEQLHLLLPWNVVEDPIELVVQKLILIAALGELVVVHHAVADAGHDPRLTER